MRLIRVPRTISMARLIRRLAAARLDEAVLAVPRGARAFRDPIGLDLLTLYAREHGMDLAVVSPDRRILERAAAAGIAIRALEEPADGALREQAAAGEERRRYEPVRLPHWFLAFAAMILIGGALAVWPRTTVVITAARKQIPLTAEILVATDYRTDGIASGRLPAQLLTKAGLAVAAGPATGSRMVGVIPSRGRVVLINESAERLVVPEATELESKGGPRFRIESPVTVPAAAKKELFGIEVSSVSGQAEAPVVCTVAGTAGNLGPNRITALIGPLARRLKVVNTAAMSGGIDRRTAVIAAEDVDRARSEAVRQMELQAPEELQALLGKDQILLPETMTITPGGFSCMPPAGAAADSVRVSLPYAARCLAITRTDLAKFLGERARRIAPAGFTLAGEAFTVQELRAAPRGAKGAVLTLTAVFTVTGRIDRRRILAAIRGRSEEQARAALLKMPEVAAVEFDPAGRRLPRMPWLIRVLPSRQGGR